MSHISSKEMAVQVKCDLTCNQISEIHFYLDFFSHNFPQCAQYIHTTCQ